MSLLDIIKQADLLPDVTLQPHQQRLADQAAVEPIRKLLIHSLGSGKTLTSIGAAEARKKPYTAIVPAALRPNYHAEQEKWTDESLPSDVMSYTSLARGQPVKYPESLVMDEAQRLRNVGSKQTINAIDAARKAKQVLLLSGTPLVNDPQDLAPLTSILTNKEISPEAFRRRFVQEKQISPGIVRRILGYTPGVEEDIAHPDELKELLKGHVDYYSPDKPVVPTTHEDIPVEMSKDQSHLYRAMWNRLPWVLRWKLRMNYPLSRAELQRMTSFLTGPRQVGLSTMSFMGQNADPYKAFQTSPKLQAAFGALNDTLKDQRTKALVFSNFIDAGLTPYAAGLAKAGVPHGVFHGGLSDEQRKKLVDDYNNNRIRVALLGPSGTEGLSFKGTQLIQQLDPHWQGVRGRQSEGRGLRYDSHWNLPEELQNVKVQRFIAKLPLGFRDRVMSALGFDESDKRRASDDYIRGLAEKKEKLNQKFMTLLKEVGSQR